MKIEIEEPKTLLLEITYLNGMLNGKELPEMINLSKLMTILTKLK